jgi:Domain of Unknown Function (DUF1080)
MTYSQLLICGLLLVSHPLQAQQSADWKYLFNGTDLNTFEQKNGTAEFRIEGNDIVGISKMNTRNSFLCTKSHYTDFIFELEVNIHPLLNSGIQIRSQSMPDYYEGAVHGYQIEIDPSARAYTGGIYDESRRGWLYPLAQNESGRNAFKQSQWNHLRIEAIGKDIRVWLNGVNTANIVDDLTPSGFIALQVHSISDSTLSGKEVRWRNLKILTTDLQQQRKETDPSVSEENFVANYLSPLEQQQGWRLLWDGKSTKGWGADDGSSFPEKDWTIHNGELQTSNNTITTLGKSIRSLEKFKHFELKVSFQLSETAQSGLMYLVDSLRETATANVSAFEYQLIDDQKHPDAKNGVNGNRSLGSLYDLIPAENLSRPGASKSFRGNGQWNEARIVVKEDQVEHWLNGYKLVVFDRHAQLFQALLDHSIFAHQKDFASVQSGHIVLQHQGPGVSFRSIKIKIL